MTPVGEDGPPTPGHGVHPKSTSCSEEGHHVGLRTKGRKEGGPHSWPLPVTNQGACPVRPEVQLPRDTARVPQLLPMAISW